MHLTLLLIIAQAPHPLSVDDAAVRLTAATQWAKSKKPQLTTAAARAVKECIELPAVKETGCAQPAKLCRIHEGDDGGSGMRIESLSFILSGHELNPMRVWWSATYDAPLVECEPPEHLLATTSPEERDAEIAAWHKKHSAEYGQCVTRVKKKAAADAEQAACDVVLANACRAEAFVVCKTKNLRKSITALETVHRFTFDK